MAAQQCYLEQETGEEESTLLQDEEEEEEKALSLCDLPIYSGSISAKWGDHFSKEDGKNVDDEDDDFFEFFSEEFTTPRTENIIFCGKLIPFKDSSNPADESEIIRHSNIQKGSIRKNFEYGSSKGKVSLMRSATKSRWFVFMFGMSKISTEMELGDIRNRQSRRGPTAMFPSPEKEKEEKIKGERNSYRGMWKLVRSKISSVLGCKSIELQNDVVTAAFV